MKHRLVGGVIAGAIALGMMSVPSPTPAQAASSSCTGWTSGNVPPSSIRVLRTALHRTVTVSFRTYVETVMPAEWGSSHPAAALQAGAVAVKQYAWYYALAGHWRGGRDAGGHCYDVTDSQADQVYNPSRTPASSHLAAVAATWSWTLRRGGSFILTGYRPGIGQCGDSIDGFHLFQLEASRCAANKKWTAEQILRAYFSPGGHPLEIAVAGANDMTGDVRGDATGLTTDPGSGEVNARLYTSDPAVSPPEAAASAKRVVATIPDGALLGRGTADVNADGRLDLVQLVAGTGDTVVLQVMKSTGTGFAAKANWWTSEAGQFAAAEVGLVSGDFNGDRKGDAAIVRRTAGDGARTEVWIAVSTGTEFGPPARRLGLDRDLTVATVAAGDFSGDGRADLAFILPDGPVEVATTTRVEVATSTSSLTLKTPALWMIDSAPPAALKLAVGDVDRTGRDDLYLVRNSGGAIRVLAATSTGSGFNRRWVYTNYAQRTAWAAVKPVASDVNGDGRADLLLFTDRGLDDGGVSLGTSVLRLTSYGTYLGAPSTWKVDPAAEWAALEPH